MSRDPKSSHYDAGGIEVQDIIIAKLTPEQYKGWCLGNMIKYPNRLNFKGQPLRDAEKSGNYSGYLAEHLKTRSENECPACFGVGFYVRTPGEKEDCHMCGTTGKRPENLATSKIPNKSCGTCEGTGRCFTCGIGGIYKEVDCPECGGI